MTRCDALLCLQLLQEAPGRAADNRCLSGGIDHSFLNWLVYGRKLLPYVRVRVFAHGEGAMNSLGGLRPDTVQANLTGNLHNFWHVLDQDGLVRNWNGDVSARPLSSRDACLSPRLCCAQVSPIVHQADHFKGELLDLVDSKVALVSNAKRQQLERENRSVDRIWQVFRSTRCLFDCDN